MTVTSPPCIFPDMPSLPSRLRARRSQLNLSQAAVAKHCGVTTSAYQQWEDDGPKGTTPRRNKRHLLAEILQTSEEWLEFGEVLQSPKSDALGTRQNASSPEESKLLEIYRQLSREGRAAILGAITERFFREHPERGIEEFSRLGLTSNLDQKSGENGNEKQRRSHKRAPGT